MHCVKRNTAPTARRPSFPGYGITDDPEGMEYFQKTFEYADGDPDIYILSNLNTWGWVTVILGAVQIGAAILRLRSW